MKSWMHAAGIFAVVAIVYAAVFEIRTAELDAIAELHDTNMLLLANSQCRKDATPMIWTNQNSVVTDTNGAVLWCDECPCTADGHCATEHCVIDINDFTEPAETDIGFEVRVCRDAYPINTVFQILVDGDDIENLHDASVLNGGIANPSIHDTSGTDRTVAVTISIVANGDVLCEKTIQTSWTTN